VPCCELPQEESARAHIPEALRPALGPILEQIGSLTQRIRGFDRRLETICQEHYPETDLLRQVEGVGALSALTFVLSLENPERFAKSRSVGAYLGLVPAQDQSREGPSEAHLQGRFGDIEEAPGKQRSLHPWTFWLRLGPQASWTEAIFSRRQERKEASDRGRG
jgi:hypothetical protein